MTVLLQSSCFPQSHCLDQDGLDLTSAGIKGMSHNAWLIFISIVCLCGIVRYLHMSADTHRGQRWTILELELQVIVCFPACVLEAGFGFSVLPLITELLLKPFFYLISLCLKILLIPPSECLESDHFSLLWSKVCCLTLFLMSACLVVWMGVCASMWLRRPEVDDKYLSWSLFHFVFWDGFSLSAG